MTRRDYILLGCVALVVLCGFALVSYEMAETRSTIRDATDIKLPKSFETAVESTAKSSAEHVEKLAPKVLETLEKTQDALLPKVGETVDKAGKALIPKVGDLLEKSEAAFEQLLDNGGSSNGKSASDPDEDSDSPPRQETLRTDGAKGAESVDEAAEAAEKSPAAKPKAKSPERAADLFEGVIPGNLRPRTKPRQKQAKADAVNQAADLGKGDLVDNAFDFLDKTTQAANRASGAMLGLSPEEERAWGQRLHRQVLADQKIIKQRSVTQRIERLAEPILQHKRRDIDYTFTVIKTDEINAFSLAGGYVYLSSALLKFVNSDDELQFVLGHEIGHVDLKHCADQLTLTARASEVATPAGGQVLGMLHNLMTRPYSQAQEFDADAYGLKALWAIGKTSSPALSFLERFGRTEQQREADQPLAEADSPLSKAALRVQSHFRTHPPINDRIRRLEELSAAVPNK